MLHLLFYLLWHSRDTSLWSFLVVVLGLPFSEGHTRFRGWSLWPACTQSFGLVLAWSLRVWGIQKGIFHGRDGEWRWVWTVDQGQGVPRFLQFQMEVPGGLFWLLGLHGLVLCFGCGFHFLQVHIHCFSPSKEAMDILVCMPGPLPLFWYGVQFRLL